ncbi:hypothetical protein Fmac_027374 [Flemingia macrophylla]|uniref:Uncharacterized protein n=1 Tax=Flemingia macrophylla TaxID=520843 RepID=A0ABD1LHH6_9FABA
MLMGPWSFSHRRSNLKGISPPLLGTMLCRESKIDEMKELIYIVVGRNFVPRASMYDKFIMSLHREIEIKPNHMNVHGVVNWKLQASENKSERVINRDGRRKAPSKYGLLKRYESLDDEIHEEGEETL